MLEVAVAAARAAGAIIAAALDDPRSAKAARKKADDTWVTRIDEAAEAAAIAVVRRAFPEHDFWSEEAGDARRGAPCTWLIDPLDGTTNFVYGFPACCVSVAAVADGEPVAGVIYDPLRDECFTAARGRGAFLNGQRLTVESPGGLSEAVVMVDWGRSSDYEGLGRLVAALGPRVRAVRAWGSAALALAYVAAGRAHLAVQGVMAPWDVAAGVLLITEAGGEVSHWGRPLGLLHEPAVVAGEPALARAFLGLPGLRPPAG